jgi:DNA-binding HxlR family transcriptional regulator
MTEMTLMHCLLDGWSEEKLTAAKPVTKCDLRSFEYLCFDAQEGTDLIPAHTEMTVQLPDPATEDCRAISSILARVGDKWTVLIVVLLGDGPKRFNEIRRMVGGISQRMLTFTLRGLERDGLVTRTVFPTTPQRVDYELTKLGSTLWEAVEPLGSWARAHVGEILKSRGQFDEKILGAGKHSSSLPLRSRSAPVSVSSRARRPDPRRTAK